MILLKLIQLITLGLILVVVFTQLIQPLVRGIKFFPYFRPNKADELKEKVQDLQEEVEVTKQYIKLTKQEQALKDELNKENN